MTWGFRTTKADLGKREAECRANHNADESEESKTKANRVRKREEGPRDERAPNSLNRLGHDPIRDVTEGQNPVIFI